MSKPTEWNAVTVEEALHLLDAATKLIEARMLALHPGDPLARRKAEKTAPIKLTITLDDGELEQLGADQHVFQAQVRGDQ